MNTRGHVRNRDRILKYKKAVWFYCCSDHAILEDTDETLVFTTITKTTTTTTTTTTAGAATTTTTIQRCIRALLPGLCLTNSYLPSSARRQ